MTIAYYAGKVAIGTAAERAALSSLVAGDAGYHFRETDTGYTYYWTGSAWAVLKAGRQLTGSVFIDSADSKAKYVSLTTGAIEFTASSSSAPEEAIDYAIGLGAGATYISPGTYTYSGSFAGHTINTSKTHLIFDPAANIIVPNGYTGFVFKFLPQAGASLNYCTIKGGFFNEAGTPSHLWKWLHLSGSVSGKGISYNIVKGSVVWHPGWLLYLETTLSNSWVNSCAFENLTCFSPVIGTEFVNNTFNNISDCVFRNVTIQSGALLTTFGFKNICTARHSFRDCKVWDIDSAAVGAKTFTTQADAVDTIIDGGIMWSAGYYTDAGITTWGPPKKGQLHLEKDTQNMVVAYRPVQTTGANGRVGYSFNFQNTTPVEYVGGTLVVEPTVATAAAESAFLEVYLKNAGTLTRVFDIGNDGRVYCGGINRRIILSDTGLTAQRTVTWNDANTKVLGETNTQTVTNKTIDPQLNTIPYTRYFGVTKKIGRYNMVASTGSGEGLLAIAPGSFGTVGSVVTDSTGLHLPYTTGATINTTAGLRWTRFTARSLNPWFIIKAKLNSTANVRASIFFTSSSANPTTNADSLANLSGVGFFYDSGVNANWRIYSNSGGASSTNADSAVAATTAVTTFEVKAIDATPAFQWRIDGYPAGAWSANVTSTIPATNTQMCIQIWIEDLASADSKQVDWYDVQVIQDG